VFFFVRKRGSAYNTVVLDKKGVYIENNQLKGAISMNPDDLKKVRGITEFFMGSDSIYGLGGLNEWADTKDIQELLTEFIEKDLKTSKETKVKPEIKESLTGEKEKKVVKKQEHAWKLRERRYRAWATQKGEGKMVESHQFNFLSEFFQHLEEEYDFYDLMDGVCLDEEKQVWVYEGDIVEVVGGEYHQGYYEYNVTGVFDCRGASYCLVDFKNVLYSLDDLFNVAEKLEVVGTVYDQNFQAMQEAYSQF
jgi:hypothetical protein